jgi:hypothetical protein
LNDLFILHQNVVAQAKHPKLRQQSPRNQNSFMGTTELLCHLWTSPEEIEKHSSYSCRENSAATHGTQEFKNSSCPAETLQLMVLVMGNSNDSHFHQQIIQNWMHLRHLLMDPVNEGASKLDRAAAINFCPLHGHQGR